MHDNWYCIVLGSELGPMPWENLVELAQKGVLKPQHEVRRGAGGVCVEAGRIPELARHLAMVQTTSDDERAQQNHAPARAEADQDDAFEFSARAGISVTTRVEPPPSRASRSSASIAYAASTAEMPSSPRTASELVRSADLIHDNSVLSERNVTTASAELSTPRKAPTVVVPPPASSAMTPDKPARAEKPKKERKEKAAKRAAPSTSPRRAAPSRSLGIDRGKLARAALGLATVCVVGAGGYFGWQFVRGPRVDKSGRPVLSSVDDMRGKLNYARNKLREGQYFGDLKSQFEARLSAARPAVDSLPPGPLAENLKTALALLGEMSALPVARGADEDSLYLERDTKLESLLAQARQQFTK
jgi:cell envelope opacity-associated protein A